MECFQKEITLASRSRGFHLVTNDILREVPELAEFKTGLFHVFIQHTSASLSLNENADPTVRSDFESHFNEMVPENAPYYRHTMEGPDDMPAHIKAALLGSSLTLPVTGGAVEPGDVAGHLPLRTPQPRWLPPGRGDDLRRAVRGGTRCAERTRLVHPAAQLVARVLQQVVVAARVQLPDRTETPRCEQR